MEMVISMNTFYGLLWKTWFEHKHQNAKSHWTSSLQWWDFMLLQRRIIYLVSIWIALNGFRRWWIDLSIEVVKTTNERMKFKSNKYCKKSNLRSISNEWSVEVNIKIRYQTNESVFGVIFILTCSFDAHSMLFNGMDGVVER